MTKVYTNSLCLEKLPSDLKKKISSTGGWVWLTPSGLSDRNQLEILTFLLEAGASPSMENRFGFNSLHLLC